MLFRSFTGEMISADEAYRIGLADRIVPKGTALDEAIRLADVIVSRAPRAVQMAKRVIREGIQTNVTDALVLEAEGFAELCETDDKNEGAKAFFEKRTPNYTGK